MIGLGLILTSLSWSQLSSANSSSKPSTRLEVVLREAPQIQVLSDSSELWSWRWPWSDDLDPLEKHPTYLVTRKPELKITATPELSQSLALWKNRRSRWSLPKHVGEAYDLLQSSIEAAVAEDSRSPAKSVSPRTR